MLEVGLEVVPEVGLEVGLEAVLEAVLVCGNKALQKMQRSVDAGARGAWGLK